MYGGLKTQHIASPGLLLRSCSGVHLPPPQSFLTVIAPVVMEPLGIEMDDISADVVQKALVVRDNQQRLPPALKVAAV